MPPSPRCRRRARRHGVRPPRSSTLESGAHSAASPGGDHVLPRPATIRPNHDRPGCVVAHSATSWLAPDADERGAKPTPLLPEEVDFILKQMGMKERKAEVDFQVGEMIEVLEGPFAHFQGKVEEIDQDKGKVRVSVDMFGRETIMELDFEQVEKI